MNNWLIITVSLIFWGQESINDTYTATNWNVNKYKMRRGSMPVERANTKRFRRETSWGLPEERVFCSRDHADIILSWLL